MSDRSKRRANRRRLSLHATRTDLDGMDGYRVRKNAGGKRTRQGGANDAALIARIYSGA